MKLINNQFNFLIGQSYLALISIIVIAITLGIAAQSVYAQGPVTGWQVVKTVAGTVFEDIEMLSTTDGWVVGGQYGFSTVFHWDGNSWNEVADPGQNMIFAVDMINGDEGWFGGSSGELLHYNTGVWVRLPPPTTMTIQDIDMLSTDEGWAVGGSGYPDYEGVILHYQNNTWQVHTTPVIQLNAVKMFSANEGWAVGGNGVIYHYNNGSWQNVSSPTTDWLFGLDMVSTNEGWAVGSYGTILHYFDGTWQKVSSPTSHRLYDVDMLSADEGWAVAHIGGGNGGVILHYLNGTWYADPGEISSGLFTVDMLTNMAGWAAGADGDNVILQYIGVGLETYSISGQVTDNNNNSIAGVTISDGAGHNITTDNNGDYTLNDLGAGNYTLTPSKNGYIFTPALLTIDIPPNASGQDFTATPVARLFSQVNYGGSTVYSGGIGFSNSPNADSYSMDFPIGWSVKTWTGDNRTGSERCWTTSIPNLQDHGWHLAIQSIQVFEYDACTSTYSISGQIVDNNNNPISGVIISDGAGHTAPTDNSGNYTLTGLSSGSHTLTPSKSGYTFSPTLRSVSVPPDATGQDFTATQSGSNKPWTMMLYMAGDTGVIDSGNVYSSFGRAIQQLEEDSNPNANVVALLDGPNTTDTFRVTFTPQANYQPLGEKQMDNPSTLVDFVQQAMTDFPADHYYLVIADHANGVQGIAWDTTTNANKTALLTPAEIRQALVSITNDGASPIDVIHFDGCTFGLLEDVAIAQDLANYAIVSQNIGWSVFAYGDYRDVISSGTQPVDFAREVAETYAQKVTDQQYPYTISTLDMNRLNEAITALNAFADNLTSFANVNQTNRTLLNNIRSESQKFDSGGEPYLTINDDDKYVDLVDFATRAKLQISSNGIPAAADSLIETITDSQPFVIFESHRSGTFDYFGEVHTWNLDGAHGVSIYYPPRAAGATYSDYTAGVIFPNLHNQSTWRSYLQAGVPPLAPGDPIPDDGPEPLTPLQPRQYLVYLPLIVR